MSFAKFFAFSSIAILFVACGGGAVETSQLFNIQLEGKSNQFKQNQTVGISIKNKKNKTIQSVIYTIDGKELEVVNDKITFDVQKLGNKILKAKIDYDDTSGEITKKIKILSNKAPEIYTYEVLNEYPHDTKSFTQGLEFHNDTLYEGTGKKGKSVLRKINYKTGEILREVKLASTIFGEGITILNDKIYQLSWQSGIGFVYNLSDLKKLDNFNYGQSKEGWGLTNNGKQLIKSDGTEKIWFLDPNTLIEEGYIETVTNSSIFNKANELEYVDGKIYANVWQKESMMIINAENGAITGVVNFGGLKNKLGNTEAADVLNGIAYHPERKTFFVTGKYWDRLFEVNIFKRQ
ncbi:glutaminyl-peptide cyclotransferase [Costertonia aggregata]|uniref:Glutaminyl-peptide cyclotransferase n=1 Tax=Costertonia aggregata TaxID=343403 RepID=A0A7H9AKK5_9FLAO|nr:glutaminyl-peptide cyclotransferase [Costertonia aggregata]QLG43815.1 glutaminyl-peptide cyclotransferase [Costertonia aggregata]